MHTNADKRVAVAELLQDPAWQERSDRSIARESCVSAPLLVASVRAELGLDAEARVGRDGRRVRVAAIGRKPKAHCKRLTVSTPSEDDRDPQETLRSFWRRAHGAFRELVERDPAAASEWLEDVVLAAQDTLSEAAPRSDD